MYHGPSAEGTPCGSRARQCRVEVRSWSKSRGDGTLPGRFVRIKHDPRFPQHRFKLTFVRPLPMVPGLVLNVILTASRFELLTLNAPYPSCHANSSPCSCSQREEFAFKTWTALATGMSDGKTIGRCEWFEVPPAASTDIPWFRPIPAKYFQSLDMISSGMRSRRDLVLKTQWMRTLGYL